MTLSKDLIRFTEKVEPSMTQLFGVWSLGLGSRVKGLGFRGDRVETQPNGRKHNPTGENTTEPCLWAGPYGRNHNWLLRCRYKFGHALQTTHGTSLKFQDNIWIMVVVIRPLSLHHSTNIEHTIQCFFLSSRTICKTITKHRYIYIYI